MFCDRCGSPNPDGSAFCARCGTRLGVPQGKPAVARAPVALAEVPPEPYDAEQPLYDPGYDGYGEYDDESYEPSFDPLWDPAYGQPFDPSYGQPIPQPSDQDLGQLPDSFYDGQFDQDRDPFDTPDVPQGPSTYGSPYREDDPYLAQYLSQQQYRAEHGYMTPGSPGPRGKGPVPEEADGPLKEKRSLALYFFLSIITLGIYGWYATHCMARDANTLCAADGERTTGVGLYALFSLLTFGIYSIYWIYKLAERLYQNAPAYGVHFEQNGLVILLWYTVGALILVGPFIAMHYVFRDLDELSRVYNERYVFNWR